MRKTKIVCTLGPATDKDDVLKNMILAGMNVARFNFSHGSHEEHKGRLNTLLQLRKELQLPVAALLDTKGPEIRLRDFKEGKVNLKAGNTFTLTAKEIDGDETIVAITFKELYKDVHVGSHILLDDGKIDMTVEEIKGEDIVCKIINGGDISNHKGVNVPGVTLSLPYLSEVDKSDILFGIENDYDFIAASFTRSATDVLDIRTFLEENGCDDMKIIAKIENQDGVNNIVEILEAADGIMVARGDMGVEIDFTEIPIIQKELISSAYKLGKTTITATQMLESMMQNPRPTRAEITDVANAIYDGTSAIMLSGETAAGKYPVEAVKTMAAIAERTESDISYEKRFRNKNTSRRLSVTSAVAHATCTTAMDIGASAILTVTQSGETARYLCKYRPSTPIVACVMHEKVARQLSLAWGITPVIMPFARNTDEMISLSVAAAKDAALIHDGDLVVITAGVPVGVPGTTNMIKAHLVGDFLATGVGVGELASKGKVCIINSLEDVKNKFKAGDVLVTTSTDNDMLEAIRESSGIIAEENGMNSHAAIVGLTLGKPVIIGAVGATTKLKDGQMISIDAERGIVQAIES